MPVAAAVMFAMLLAMAPQPATSLHEALLRTAWCAGGAFLYVLYATASNALLNGRYRTQTMAGVLLSVAALMRTTPAASRTPRPARDRPRTLAPSATCCSARPRWPSSCRPRAT
jgi:drug/metabolite transporter (DMT)-like permease